MVILGTSGAGKTTVASALSQRLDLPHIDLDVVAAAPGRHRKLPAGEFRARVVALLDEPCWIIDGDYERGRAPSSWTGSTRLGDLVLRHADTAIWLELPLRVSVLRMWRRTAQRIDAARASGEHAAWRLDHLRWAQWEARSHARRRMTMRRRLARRPHLTVVHLKSQREIDDWLALQAEHDATTTA